MLPALVVPALIAVKLFKVAASDSPRRAGVIYFLTGLRRSEVIGLRGKDLEMRGGALVIKYRRKGGKFTAKEVADPAAYEALRAYLEAAGRGNVLETERPLWTRHDRAGRPGAPLSSRAFVENLKAYAKEAG